jgi:phage shock protein E
MLTSFFNKAKINHLDADEFEKKMKETPDSFLIDVRTEEEHFNTRIPNSVLINVYEPGFMKEIEKLEREKSYFVYCHSGGRSSVICEQMMKIGFTKVYNLEDGIVSWRGKLEHSS